METQNTKTREEIYLNFLIDLKSMLDNTSYVSVSKLAKKHEIGANVTVALQDGGIIKNSGTVGRGAIWSWSTKVSPNVAMAKELIERSQKIKNDWQEERKEKNKEVKKKKLQPKQEKSNKSISILWGLIKIQS